MKNPRQTPQVPEIGCDAEPPRKNGEPVFDAPWESRAFGMVVDLHSGGAFAWDHFKNRLIGEIAAGSANEHDCEHSAAYYAAWLQALSRLLIDDQILSAAEIDGRTQEYLRGVRR